MHTSSSYPNIHSGGSELTDLTSKPSWMYDLPPNSDGTYGGSALVESTSATSTSIYNQAHASIEKIGTGNSSRLSRRPFARTSTTRTSTARSDVSRLPDLEPGYSVVYGGNHHITKYPPPSSIPTGTSTYDSSSIVTLTADGPRIDYTHDAYGVRNATSGVISLPEIQKELPDEWVAVTSKLNACTFFYNTRTKKTQWHRPFRAAYPAPPPLPDPPPPVCHHNQCKSYSFCTVIGPQMPTDEDLNYRSMEHDLVSIDFATALMRFGPRVLLYKILMASVVHCFETWHENAIQSRIDREHLHFNMACKIQAQYRRVLVEREMIDRIREYKKRLKCADFPDIRDEMKHMIENMSDDTRSWFLPFTGAYLQRVIHSHVKKKQPKCCINSQVEGKGCIQPKFLTQKNGYCVNCNFAVRFPAKAALRMVLASMGE